jgi:hypothetical protein
VIFNICYAPVLVLVVVIVKKWYVSKKTCSRLAMRRIYVEMVKIETAQPVLSQEARPTTVSTPVGSHVIQYFPMILVHMDIL